MPNQFTYVFFIVSIIVIFSPVYLQRRKLWRMADEDLKRIDYNERKKQMLSNAYIKLISRVIWGLFVLSGFFFNFREVVAVGFNWTTIFVLVLGISFIAWGVLGFRREIQKGGELR